MERMEITEESELVAVAQGLIQRLQESQNEGAEVIALHGDLGAGKTALVKTIARELGVTQEVTSPTFVIMKVYETPEEKSFAHLVHIDAYRVEDIDEMRVLRFGELLAEKDTIICIEWAERIQELLPPHTAHVHMRIEGEKRVIELK